MYRIECRKYNFLIIWLSLLSAVCLISETALAEQSINNSLSGQIADIETNINTALQKVSPAVVSINTERKNRIRGQSRTQEDNFSDLFYRNFKHLFKSKDFSFNRVHRNLKKKGIGEYDIVGVGDGQVLVIEVKNKLRKKMVDDFLYRRIPMFKEAFPKYRDCAILGGMGALVVKDDIGRYAEKAGL